MPSFRVNVYLPSSAPDVIKTSVHAPPSSLTVIWPGVPVSTVVVNEMSESVELKTTPVIPPFPSAPKSSTPSLSSSVSRLPVVLVTTLASSTLFEFAVASGTSSMVIVTASSSPDTSSRNSSRPNWSSVLSSRSVMPGPSPMSPPSNGVLKAPPAAAGAGSPAAGATAAGAMAPRSNPSMEATNWSKEMTVPSARVRAGGRSACANTR